MDFAALCHQARLVVTGTGDFIREQLGKVKAEAIEEKALNSLVSYVDKEAEQQLVGGLGKLLPEATFLTEEETVAQQEGDLRWIIDPLDGTTNFLHQLPIFSVSVALQQKGKTVIGIVYEINQDECFYAWQGGGAFMNDQPIRVSSNANLADSLTATGFPYYDYDKMEAYMSVLQHFMRHTRGIRRLGSAAVDLVYVACGRFDFFYEYSLNAWDVAGGAFIVQEAGGKVSDFQGGDNYMFGKELIASSSNLFPEVLEVVKSKFD